MRPGIWITSIFLAQAVLGAMTSKAEPLVTREVLEAISSTATAICSESTENVSPPSTELELLIASRLNELADELVEMGASPGRFAPADYSLLVARSETEHDCRLVLMGGLVEALLREKPLAECRHPSHGIELYSEIVEVTERSPWLEGGYSPSAWCSDAASRLANKHKDAMITVVGQNESRRMTGFLNLKPEYQYSCRLQIAKDPVYRLASSSACEARESEDAD